MKKRSTYDWTKHDWTERENVKTGPELGSSHNDDVIDLLANDICKLTTCKF